MSQENDARRSCSVPVSVRMPVELDRLISETAREIKLSKPTTIRLSLERGVEILKKQLAMPAAKAA